ncbi:hypothetical protein [Hyphomicrobium sulfonivorans]|uniref:hypothetical protein n=1 Tax=Hyphomicrobium sulfonivorans TaxID=121290 RepID=UPI00156DE78F|nr:hypothetical protein [Hyphomicrobium sulfonivorans]MBI1650382.1 hypothetical protein [Hyphomicrobium sulfonivorans]NSL72255.1 hypothetical protein [Hyphomicrobium sulfonivorans]
MIFGKSIAVTTLAVVSAVALSFSAFAQDSEVIDGEALLKDEQPPVVDGAVIVDDAPIAVSPGTRVYGWSGRRGSGSCGMYHYWDGARCADARVDPPAIDY